MIRFRRYRFVSIFVLLVSFPVVLLLARAQNKPDPARWEKNIDAFEEHDKKSPPPENGALFVGSSSIVKWDVKRSFPGLDAINRGFGGSQISDVNYYLSRVVLKYKPRVIVFYSGDNDIAAGKAPEQLAADLKTFVEGVHKELPKTTIVVLGVKPSPARRKLLDVQRKANGLIAELCKHDTRLVYVDVEKPMLGTDGEPREELFLSDKLHMNAKGYELWTGLVKKHVEKQ